MRLFLHVIVSQPVEKENTILLWIMFVYQVIISFDKISVTKTASVRHENHVIVLIVRMVVLMISMHVAYLMVYKCIVLAMSSFHFPLLYLL